MVHETFIGGGLSSVSWPMWFPFGSADFGFFQCGIKRRTSIIKERSVDGPGEPAHFGVVMMRNEGNDFVTSSQHVHTSTWIQPLL